MESLAYYNGVIKPLEEMKIPITDRSIYFGDGVYEVVYCLNNTPFALKEHINRFYSSLKLLKINFNMPKEELKKTIEMLVKKQGSQNQIVYWQVSRGAALRDHVFPENASPNLLITVKEKEIKNMKSLRYNLIIEPDTRFLHCNIKTINLIPAVLASEKAKQNNCDEAILHRNGRVTECAHSNVAILKDGVFKTAPLDNLILPGVTRAHLIQFCKELKIPVLEKPFNLEELKEADEVIVCASGCLCMGVNSINGIKIKNSAPRLLEALQNRYEQELSNQCKGFKFK